MKNTPRLWASLVLLVGSFSSCPLPLSGVTLESIPLDGRPRTYLLHVPQGYDGATAVPLVLVLHGFLETGFAAARITRFAELADRGEGFIAVFPNALRRAWRYQATGEDTPGFLRQIDDVAFVDALLDRLQADYNVDPNRIYAAGFSAGGFMAQRLACAIPERIAAVAAVSASLTEDSAEACAPAVPVPVVMLAGTADPIVPYEGGPVRMGPGRETRFLSMEETAAFWAERNGCASPPEVTPLPDTDPGDGTTVDRLDYGGCAAGAGVTLYRIEGGGHAWPGGRAWYPERITGRTSRDFDGPEAVWAFFEAHPKPVS